MRHDVGDRDEASCGHFAIYRNSKTAGKFRCANCEEVVERKIDRVEVVKRSEIEPEVLYSVEERAPGGNWVRSLGTNDLETARSFAGYATRYGKEARVVKEGE